ncbi:MAG TPA: NAD(P)H-hydrate dehydratase, partial [Pirellulaceae bacterium]|nr:NAD(P)H-hydrate dehydratase [Pirellulaceae bacterium]
MFPLPQLPPRNPDSHKGDFGRALLIGGSRGMAGAIALAGIACLRSGAGLVRVAAPEDAADTVARFETSYMVTPLAQQQGGELDLSAAQREIEKLLEWATCIAIGPGLGQSQPRGALVRWLYKTAKQPVVVDADGL